MLIFSPCPFCGSGHVALVSAGRRFQHYRCGTCAEVWTAQGDVERPRPDDDRPAERGRAGGPPRTRLKLI